MGLTERWVFEELADEERGARHRALLLALREATPLLSLEQPNTQRSLRSMAAVGLVTLMGPGRTPLLTPEGFALAQRLHAEAMARVDAEDARADREDFADEYAHEVRRAGGWR